MKDYEALYDTLERIINYSVQLEKKKKLYLKEYMLSMTEVHVLDTIGNNPGIGVSELAALKGVTLGAVSQMIRKLREKGLVNKDISKESEAKVEISLTSIGKQVLIEHQKQHKQAITFFKECVGEVDTEVFETLKYVIERYDTMLRERLQDEKR